MRIVRHASCRSYGIALLLAVAGAARSGRKRFISPDSIVPRPDDPQSFNRYAYARNSPLVRFVYGLTGKAYDPAVTSQEFLTGVSLNVRAGVILGGQLVWSPATSFGGEVGASLGGYAGLSVQIPLLMFDGQGVFIPLPSCDRSGCFSVIP
ncbi:MAG: hypothetical protein ACFLMY_00525 [Candidatus Brachytrichaceae bacterium NZ_4S206]|jgi:hypothetical protein